MLFRFYFFYGKYIFLWGQRQGSRVKNACCFHRGSESSTSSLIGQFTTTCESSSKESTSSSGIPGQLRSHTHVHESMYMKTKSKYQQELYKIGANIHDNGHGKSLMRLQLYAKNYKQLKTLKWKK